MNTQEIYNYLAKDTINFKNELSYKALLDLKSKLEDELLLEEVNNVQEEKRIYIQNHKEKTQNIFINFSNSDIYNIDYRALNSNGKQYNCYGIKFIKFGKKYYVYKESENDLDNYKDHLQSIQEVNGYIRALYKIYHKQLVLN